MSELGRAHRGSALAMIVILGLGNALSLLDRAFLNLVLDPVRTTMKLTDTQMGLLIGPAFVLFYSLVALPLGRIADSSNRKWLIIAGMSFWSLCTGLFGLVHNYMLLLLARMGTGLGEAALTPSAVSMMSDRLPRDMLGRAISSYTALGAVGGSLALIGGGALMGWLNGYGQLDLPIFGLHEPWQIAFLILMVPGLFLTVLLLLFVPEPSRRSRSSSVPDTKNDWRETIVFLKANPRAVLAMVIGFSVISAGSGGAWVPTFFLREYGWTAAQAGPWLGSISLSLNFVGVLTGGFLADWLRRRGMEDANLRVAIGALTVAWLCDLAMPNVGNPWLSLMFYAPASFSVMVCFGVSTASIPIVVPDQMRAQVVALYLLITNLVGQGLGPVLIPLLTDHVFEDPAALKYSLTIVPGVLFPIAIFFLLFARKPFIARSRLVAREQDN